MFSVLCVCKVLIPASPIAGQSHGELNTWVIRDYYAHFVTLIHLEINYKILQDEVSWLDQLQVPKVRIDSHGFPESFALTETDREYFNIIKTEDGTSDFIR